MDWEADPTFDPATGRPHLFRDVGAFPPRADVEARRRPGAGGLGSASGAAGFAPRRRHLSPLQPRAHRGDPRDAGAAAAYLAEQAPREAHLAETLGLSAADLEYQSGLIAFVDNLSLALCGELKTPLELPLPEFGAPSATSPSPPNPKRRANSRYRPWPFARERFRSKARADRLPAPGRFADEAAFRVWSETAPRATFAARLSAP